ncbi:MAG: hypothetical protein ACI3XJ_05970 [Oscillospiraceae bacterium]
MKKTSKRILSLLLAAMMVLSLFAGCGSKTSSGSSAKADDGYDPLIDNDETINLTVFSQLANWSGAQTGWGAVLLKDMFNIELTIIPDSDGTYETRMESGNLGDIVVWGSNGDEYKAAVDQGMLFDWEEEDLVATYGKDILSYFPDALEANRELNADGKIYGYGYNVASESGQHDLFTYDWGIRWDAYAAAGYPEVKDLDDFVVALKAMKEAVPTGDDGKTTYAASLWPDWDGNMVMYVKALAEGYYGYKELGIGLYDSATGDFYDCLEENGPYLNALKFFNNLYQAGLLDPDSMTQTYDTMIAKVRSGNILFSIFDYAGSIAFNSEQHVAENKYMAPLVPKDASVIVEGLTTAGKDRIWSIGNNTVYPEKCMQLINWLSTPDGAMTIWYGIKGLMWDYDENGNTYFTELGKKCYEDNSTDLTGVEWTSPYTGKTYTLDGTFNDGMLQINNTTWASGAENPDSVEGECFHQSTWASRMGDAKNDTEADWREKTGCVGTQEYLDSCSYTMIPAVNFAEATKSPELDLKWQQVIKAIKEGSWNAMYAKTDAEFQQIVDNMRSACNGYGYDECVQWCREQAAARFALQ